MPNLAFRDGESEEEIDGEQYIGRKRRMQELRGNAWGCGGLPSRGSRGC